MWGRAAALNCPNGAPKEGTLPRAAAHNDVTQKRTPEIETIRTVAHAKDWLPPGLGIQLDSAAHRDPSGASTRWHRMAPNAKWGAHLPFNVSGAFAEPENS